jgi:hypothetical protein
MTRTLRAAAALAIALAAVHGASVRAQWGYPAGYGAYGWGGWGGGETVQGSIARGMGAYAAGAGYYNQQTAIANSINTDTVMRWNQYMFQSQVESNRRERARMAERQYGTTQARDKVFNRLRNNPDPRDIYQGDALNVAVEEIEDPRVYSRGLKGTRVAIGGEAVRNIPFQYAPGAITTSIHQLTQGPPPAAMMTADFEEDRTAFRALRNEIRQSLDAGERPNPETVDKALAVINKAEAKADRILAQNTRDRTEVDKFLKSLHGLVAMLKTPALDVITAGVEKNPNVTLGQLLEFMRAFNLRFGVASTPTQRKVYDMLYPKLVDLRNEVGPALASAPAPKVTGNEPGEFFSGMTYQDLKKKAPPPPPPAGGVK